MVLVHFSTKFKRYAPMPYCILHMMALINDYTDLSHDAAFWSEITPCNKIDKPLVVYRFSGNLMTSITTLRTQ